MRSRSQDRQLLGRLFERQLSRRSVLQAGALAASLPAVTTLLAACGGDEDPTATTTTAEPTATSGAAATATEAMEPTAAATMAEATATMEAEATPTEAMAEPSPTADETGGVNPRHMGYTIEPAASEGGIAIEGRLSELSPPWLLFAVNPINELMVERHPETSEPIPNLLEAWESNDDASVWTFQVRQEVPWHDGEILDVDDMVFTFNLWKTVGVVDYQTIETIEPEGTDSVTVTFSAPYPFAPEGLGAWGPFAEHVAGEIPDEELANWAIIDHPGNAGTDTSFVVGTGPFKFKEFVPGSHITTERFDDYWDGRPHLDEITVQAGSSLDAMLTMIQAGDIDVIGGVFGHSTPVDPAAAKTLEGTSVQAIDYSSPGYDAYFMNLNSERTELFQDQRVRHALLLALDRPTLIESIRFGYGDLAHGTMWAGWGFDQEQIEVRYDYDPDQANALLDEAGWVVGEDGVREKDGQRFSFTILYQSGETTHESYAAAFQEYWRQIGIEALPEGAETTLFYERDDTGDFDIRLGSPYSERDQRTRYSCFGWGPPYGNGIAYCNEEVDALLEQLVVETDPETRNALLVEYQNLLMTDLPVGPICFNRSIAAVNSRLHNTYPNAHGISFNLETWWVEQ